MAFDKEYLSSLDDAIGSYRAVADQLGESARMERIIKERARLDENFFRLVVIGEIKKGKSSFINALLGTDGLLPTASDVATSTVYKVVYGPRRNVRVFFRPGAPQREGAPPTEAPQPIDIPHDKLAEYGTEDGNPNNEKNVDFIVVEEPHPLLKQGLAIIDTPGLGGLFRKHAEITWRYIPRADAVFFVLDSVEAVASADEMEFLKKIQKITPFIAFFQTKIDAVEEAQRLAWRDRNLELISQASGKPKAEISYSLVSAKLKLLADAGHSAIDLERSGYSAVMKFFGENLLRKKERALAQGIVDLVKSEVDVLRGHLDESIVVATAEGQDGISRCEEDLRAAQVEFENWERTTYRTELEQLRDDLTDLKSRTRQELANKLDPSCNGPIVSSVIKALSEREFDPQALNEHVAEVQSACLDQCAQVVFDTQGRFNEAADRIIGSTVRRISETGFERKTQAVAIAGPTAPLAPSLGMRTDRFDSMRQQLYGGMAGGMMAALGINALAWVIPPLGAITTFATIVGGAIGAFLAGKSMKARKRDEAIQKLQGALMDSVSRARQQALQQFEDTAVLFERQARDRFNAASDSYRAALKRRLEECNQARGRTRDEAASHVKALREKVVQLTKAGNLLDRLARA